MFFTICKWLCSWYCLRKRQSCCWTSVASSTTSKRMLRPWRCSRCVWSWASQTKDLPKSFGPKILLNFAFQSLLRFPFQSLEPQSLDQSNALFAYIAQNDKSRKRQAFWGDGKLSSRADCLDCAHNFLQNHLLKKNCRSVADIRQFGSKLYQFQHFASAALDYSQSGRTIIFFLFFSSPLNGHRKHPIVGSFFFSYVSTLLLFFTFLRIV